jgi:hypothetical protein
MGVLGPAIAIVFLEDGGSMMPNDENPVKEMQQEARGLPKRKRDYPAQIQFQLN